MSFICASKNKCVCIDIMAAVSMEAKVLNSNGNNSLTLQVDDLSVCVQKKHLAEESVSSFNHLLINSFPQLN